MEMKLTPLGSYISSHNMMVHKVVDFVVDHLRSLRYAGNERTMAKLTDAPHRL